MSTADDLLAVREVELTIARNQLKTRQRELRVVERERDEARAETQEIAAELAQERTLHQRTLAELERLRAEMDADEDPRHVIDFRRDGWTIKHPLSCRPNLFECPVNRAAERDLVEAPEVLGRFYCDVRDGEFKVTDFAPAASTEEAVKR